MTASHIQRLARLDSCAVSDALDELGLHGVLIGISPMTTTGRVLAGRISTVAVEERRDNRPRPHLGSKAIEAGGPGTVILVANAARIGVSSWGGILSQAAHARGIEGVVVDGACRDVDEVRELGFAIFARGAVPITARGRIVEKAVDVPVEVGTVRVDPGDYLIADGSGTVCFPQGLADDVLAIAEKIAAKESRIAAAVAAGEPISRAMHDRVFERPSDNG